ncbi:MAG: hypothetical protein ILO34_06505, partial [Kiritimatiellae bacterium]|nr:hypothetical protein [Kiritimatiellia bacterium]
EDYDIVRTSKPGYSTGTVEGDNAGMANFWNIVYNQGFGANYSNNYNKVRGLNPDGTRNENYPIYLNVTNLLVEMYSAHYAADTDSPASGGMPNNIAAFRNRVDGKGKEDGWMFNRHDAEWSLGFGGGYNSDTCGYGSKAEAGCSVFNPAGIHYELMANAEYRMVAADLFHKFFLREGGAMTAPVAEARFRSRMAEIDEAIVCENARWGWDRATWLYYCENICINFLRNRVPYLKYHSQNRGWYPSIDAPSALDEDGNLVADGTRFESEGKVYLGGAGGTVYYTTDGSDPRLEGGAVASGAQVYDTAATGDEAGIVVPAAGLVLKARVLTGSGEWSALEEVEVVGSNPPSTISSSIRFAEVCGIPADGIKGDTGEYVVLTNTSDTAGFDVSGMNVVVGKRKDIEKSGDAGSKMNIVLPEGSFIAACGSLRLDQADFGIEGGWDKITNGDLILRLYTAGGALVQSSAVDQNNFPTVTDANMLGASLIATDFGAETSESGWRASVSPEYYYLRFLAFDGLPPDSEGDLYEWFALTNLSDTAALDLTGVRVVIGKTAKDGSFDEASSKMNVVIAGGTLAAASSNRFDKASFGPEWDKITNGDIALRLYDAYGLLIQSSALKQKNFSAYYGSGGPGGEDWLVATSFGRVLAESDWAESSSIGGDADKVAEDIAAIEAAKSGDVALPNEADVAIDGNTVTITIGSASDTVEVPAYYTPSYTAGTLSLALNDLALPTIADTLEEETVVIPAIQVVDGEIQLNVTAAESALWYGLKIAASPSAEWDAIEVENWVSGEALTTLTAEADGDAGFYKIVVTDIDPTL